MTHPMSTSKITPKCFSLMSSTIKSQGATSQVTSDSLIVDRLCQGGPSDPFFARKVLSSKYAPYIELAILVE